VARPDGSANVILEGVARVRITEYAKQRPYRIGSSNPWRGSEDAVEGKREPLLRAVTQLGEGAGAHGRGPAESSAERVAFRSRTRTICRTWWSYTLLDDYYDKQAMLETLDTDERLEKLLALLQKKSNSSSCGKPSKASCRINMSGTN